MPEELPWTEHIASGAALDVTDDEWNEAVSRSTRSAPERILDLSPGEPLRIGVAASRKLRHGPRSDLIRLFRDFQPFFTHLGNVELHMVGGAHKAVQRYTELDTHFTRQMPAGFEGGVRAIAELVQRTEARPGLQGVIFLTDPTDPKSLFPEIQALRSECSKAGIPFLTNYASARQWLTLLTVAMASPEFTDSFFLDDRLVDAWHDQRSSDVKRARPSSRISRQTVAVMADSQGRQEVIDFAGDFHSLLLRYRRRISSYTTAALLNGDAAPMQARDEELPTDSRWDLDDLDDAVTDERGAADTPWFESVTHAAGDVLSLARLMSQGELQQVFFLDRDDPDPRHQTSVAVLERSSQVNSNRVIFVRGDRAARNWADISEVADRRRPIERSVSLARVLGEHFGVHTVLTEDDNWDALSGAASRFVLGSLASLGKERFEEGRKLQIAVGWGRGTAEVIDSVIEQISHAPSDLLVAPAVPDAIRVVPMLGIMGVTRRRLESNEIARRLGDALNGTYRLMPWPGLAYSDEQDYDDVDPPEWDELEESWNALDLAVFTCGPNAVAEEYGVNTAAGLRWVDLGEDIAGQAGGIFLDKEGKPVEIAGVTRSGVSAENLQDLRQRTDGDSVLVVGAEENRLEAALGSLRSELASVIVTSRSFAAKLLEAELDGA